MIINSNLFLVIVTLTLTSCSVIGPRAIHAPLFDEKGEKHLAVLGSVSTGVEIQFDYAFSNKYFLLTDVSGAKYSNLTCLSGSIGIGRYSKIGNRGKFSIYGGSSFGNFGNSNARYIDRSKFLLPFLGMNLGFKTNFFEPVFTVRLTNNTYIRELGKIALSYGAFESAGTLRFGTEKLKFHAQLGLSYPFDSRDGLATYIINAGLTFRFLKKE